MGASPPSVSNSPTRTLQSCCKPRHESHSAPEELVRARHADTGRSGLRRDADALTGPAGKRPSARRARTRARAPSNPRRQARRGDKPARTTPATPTKPRASRERANRATDHRADSPSATSGYCSRSSASASSPGRSRKRSGSLNGGFGLGSPVRYGAPIGADGSTKQTPTPQSSAKQTTLPTSSKTTHSSTTTQSHTSGSPNTPTHQSSYASTSSGAQE